MHESGYQEMVSEIDELERKKYKIENKHNQLKVENKSLKDKVKFKEAKRKLWV